MTFQPERFFDVDHERVLVLVRATATGSSSGATISATPAHEFTLRAGLIVRFKAYPDWAGALKAAGLEE